LANSITQLWQQYWPQVTTSTTCRYIAVGIVNTLIAIFWLWLFLHLDLFPNAVSVACAQVLSMLFHYFAHRIVTFQSATPFRRQVPKYLVAAAINYGISYTIVTFGLEVMGWPNSLTSACAGITTALTGYLLARFWVYRT
jgi:putative flippase GtrA